MKKDTTQENYVSVIKAPRITEKASMLMEKNIYAFEVAAGATKSEIKKAFEGIYKIKPAKISVVNLPAKSVFVRGKKGTRGAVRKAYISLKAGDKIEIA
jgi:large subunit ribosomal protein L23